MRANVDISVFPSATEAAGSFTGTLEFSELPRVGEIVSFSMWRNDVSPVSIPGFNGLLKVESVIHAVGISEVPISLSLEPIVLPSREHLEDLVTFFERGFGLYFDAYEQHGL